MGWLSDAIPNPLQWFGLLATLAGTGAAVWAAWRAASAAKQAEAARDATIHLEQLFYLGDLVTEMQELQLIINQKSEMLVAAKADMIRGKIARFKEPWKSFQRRFGHGFENLDLARFQLEEISKEAVGSRRKSQNQWARIQVAFGEANQALQWVAGIQRVDAQENVGHDERQDG